MGGAPWTCIHCSSTSLTVESLLTQACTTSLNGAMYREAIIEPRAINVSSHFSINPAVSAPYMQAKEACKQRKHTYK